MEIKNIILLSLFFLGLVFIQFIQAESVDEIIDKHAEARGGIHRINSIHSLCMEGLRQMMGKEVAVKVTKVQGKLFRNDLAFSGGSGYSVVTPSAGWLFISGQSAAPEPLTPEILQALQVELDIDGPLLNHTAKGNKASLIGKEDIEGRQAYKIRLTLNSGKDIIYLIDKETYLVTQTRQMTPGLLMPVNKNAEAEKELITNYSDYRFIDGVLFPYKINNPGNHPGSGLITFYNIDLNKSINDTAYEPSV